jgi:serine-type D-Ala-D-Ala carboxypeptidase (penicillin-binding protein 5/6)
LLAAPLALTGLLSVGGPAGAQVLTSTTPATTPPPAKAEVLIDVTTGRELFGENEHELLPPASLTKMLTALIAIDWLRPGTEIPVSARAAGVAPDKVGMKAGQRWPLGITLHALLISSANDAAYALAERVGGSVERFAVIMRQAAAQMGMSDPPVLHDPAGLDGTEGVDGGNRISAWDLAIAARDLMANPTLASIVALKTFRFTGPDGIVYELSSHNLAFLNSYPGAIGVKTGFTDPAGVCVAEEAVRGGRAMLAIVMNGVAPDQTAAMLLNEGFATPAGTEGRDALLPPVRQPEPPAPRPPPIPPSTFPQTVPAPAPPALVVRSSHRAHPSATVNPGDIGMVGAAVAVVGGSSVLLVRRSRRPVGAHSRR